MYCLSMDSDTFILLDNYCNYPQRRAMEQSACQFPTDPRSSLDHYENKANKLKFQKIRGYRYVPFS